jgi:hypothetical protein
VGARGCLIGLLGVVAGLALVGEVGDVGTRHYATTKIEQRISQQVPGASGVSAGINSWPFLKVAVDGHVDEINARIDQLVEQPLVFNDIEVELHGVRISVGDLLTDFRVNVVSIKQGDASVTVTAAALRQAIVNEVPAATAVAGDVDSLLAQVTVTVDPSTRHLVVAAAGVKVLDFPLPGPDVLPCIPNVAKGPASVTLSCTFDQVPTAFTSDT